MPSELLAERFDRAARWAPEAIAVRPAAGEVSYGALREWVDAAARAVAEHDRIAVLPRADAGSLAVVLGAMAAGTSVVLLDRHLTVEQAERVRERARPGLIVAAGRLPAPLGGAVGPDEVVAADAARAGAAPRATPADEMLVGLTSGTSGEPKLFVRDQASWARTLDRSDAAFAVHPGHVVSAAGPLDHTHFLYGALHALTRGATVDLRPLDEAVAGEAVTHLYLVPALAADLAAQLGERRLPRVRQVLSSAAPWPEAQRARLARQLPNAEVFHFYGASELSFVGLSTPARPGAYRPFDGVEVELRGGVVHVRSDMLFAGYLGGDGELSGGPDADGWCTVGDIGTLDDDGWLTLAGRASETILSGGFNVEPAHVEAALAGVPGVAEVACVGLPDARWGAIPVAVLVLEAGATVTPADLREAARARLPQPSRPRRVYVAETLPRSPRGKLRRDAVVELVLGGGVAALSRDPERRAATR